jgi:NLI interacting factor-like phosphatase
MLSLDQFGAQYPPQPTSQEYFNYAAAPYPSNTYSPVTDVPVTTYTQMVPQPELATNYMITYPQYYSAPAPQFAATTFFEPSYGHPAPSTQIPPTAKLSIENESPQDAKPTETYLLNTSRPNIDLVEPVKHLMILDLNGTLVHRPKNPLDGSFTRHHASQSPILRPYIRDFTDFIFENFEVMIWSSAMPRNVRSMVSAALTPEQRSSMLAVWGRDKLGLSSRDYHRRVPTCKDLSRVFSQIPGNWDARNVILIDDSLEKAKLQPHNLVLVPEFRNQKDDDVLKRLVAYLQELRFQGDVARYIEKHPFKAGDWIPLEEDLCN